MNSEQQYRVYNRCKYDIGVKTHAGLQYNIRSGSFQILTATDILFIESMCNKSKFFATKKLVPVDDNGLEVDIEKIGISTETEIFHMNDDEISAMLKKSVKQISEWLDDIDDPAELHSIYLVAKDMDLPSSKLKVLNAKIPEKEWLEE